MFLSPNAIKWSIDSLRNNCHPFIGITFLASKKVELPVGQQDSIKLNSVTHQHLELYHRLDKKSDFFFQPFKGNRTTFWVGSTYPSLGLKTINTRTFANVFIHKRSSQLWGFSANYIRNICEHIDEMVGHDRPSLAAMAIWIGKEDEWPSYCDLDDVIDKFSTDFHITREEIHYLFDADISPPSELQLLDEEPPDLRSIVHQFSSPPDTPSQIEGALTAIKMRDVGPASHLDLEFGERLTLIAGDNGLGKSFLLDAAWWALTGSWAGYPAFPFQKSGQRAPSIEYGIQQSLKHEVVGRGRFDRRTHSWIESHKRPSVAALCLYGRVDGSFAISDKVRATLVSGHPKTLDLFSTKDVWDGSNKDMWDSGKGRIEGLVRDWIKWQHSADQEAFAMLEHVLGRLSPKETFTLTPGEPVRLTGDPRTIPTVRHPYGDVPILFASAGVQRILLLAYLIIWSWEEHLLACQQSGAEPYKKMVIIIDEVEAHLHPKWQRLMLPGLMSIGKLLSEHLDVQVIASTHSPMVLASVENEFSDESDVLAHLDLQEGKVTLEQLDFYKHGDVPSWLMSPVFGLTHARSRAAELAIEESKRIQLEDNASEEDISAATKELKRTLAPDDFFWSRWIYFAEQAGVKV